MRARQSPFLCQEWYHFSFSISWFGNDLRIFFPSTYAQIYCFRTDLRASISCLYIYIYCFMMYLRIYCFPCYSLRIDLRHFLFWACIEVCRYVGAYMHTLLTLPAWYYIFSPWSLHPYISTYRPNLSLLGVWNWSETHHGLHLSLNADQGGRAMYCPW